MKPIAGQLILAVAAFTHISGVIHLTPTSLSADDGSLANDALRILEVHCKRCHHDDPQVAGLDVLNRDSLLAARPGLDPYIAAGEPDRSLIWQSVETDFMPYDGKTTLSDAEKETLRRWIGEGADFPTYVRPLINELEVLQAISSDLRSMKREDRNFSRYFSLHQQWNNPGVPDVDLAFSRAAFSKLINCLSWDSEIILPRLIRLPGGPEVLYSIDIRLFARQELNAQQVSETWESVRAGYPYGLIPTSPDRVLDDAFAELEELTTEGASVLPYFRVDWFVGQASRPPRYHRLLGLEMTSLDLEKYLGVDVVVSFENGNEIHRAGFAESGVSAHSRVLERHKSKFGAYWKSHDFSSVGDRRNPFRFPLGPKGIDSDFDANAFVPAGNEIIFSLPNDLHGYLIVNGDGDRIDEAPVDIVWDRNAVSGSPAIVNGLSCIGCHKHGIRPFVDRIRQGATQLGGRQRAKVLQIYVEPQEMDHQIGRDTEAYLTALEAAISPFLPDFDEIRQIGEPVSHVTRGYQRDLDLTTAAAELGIPPDELALILTSNKSLLNLGLGGLLEPGGRIDRESWETKDIGSSNSVFQSAARELGLGIPIIR